VITDEAAEPLEAIVVESRAPNPLTTGLAWAGLAVVVLIMVWWVWTRWIDPSAGGTIARYVNGTSGVVFEDPRDEFRVTTPTQWKRTAETGPLGTTVTVADDVGPDYSFTVTKTPEPETALEDYESSLNQVAGQLATQSNASIVSQMKPTAILDVAVKEVVYQKGGTFWRARIELLKDRLYTIVAKAPNRDDAPFQRLVTSFQILGPR
jgi:hypothetical protein